jgi:transcriptional regulator with XRE-family HTH domain
MDVGMLGERLRYRRKNIGWSQETLAKEARVQRPVISMLEQGQRPQPTAATIAALATALHVTSDWLMGTGTLSAYDGWR